MAFLLDEHPATPATPKRGNLPKGRCKTNGKAGEHALSKRSPSVGKILWFTGWNKDHTGGLVSSDCFSLTASSVCSIQICAKYCLIYYFIDVQRSPCSFQPTVLNANSPILLAKEYLEPNQVPYSQHFTISCMTTTLALRTLQEIRRRPAKPRTGEPLHLGKPGCREQGAVSKMSIPGTSRGIHYEFTEIQERHRIRTDVTWVPAQAIWINCFPHYKTNPDHTKLSHLMVSIGGGLCCSGRSSSFGPWDGWNTSILGGFDGWFSLILAISPHLAPRYCALSADTSEEATPPAAACLWWMNPASFRHPCSFWI